MNTDLIVQRRGSHYAYSVHIEGLSTLMRFLKDSDPQMRKAIQEGLKEAANPVLVAARANAQFIADDGTFARSLSIRSYATGVVRLASTDEAAKVKEFARLGAKTISSKGTPLANARLRKHSGVGVPHRSNPPRVMYRALDEKAGEVANRISVKLNEVLEGIDG